MYNRSLSYVQNMHIKVDYIFENAFRSNFGFRHNNKKVSLKNTPKRLKLLCSKDLTNYKGLGNIK